MWLKNYLTDRKQFVKFNDTKSELLPMICGVPQGSILGPSLFLLYINDMCNVSDILKFVLFADDTNIFHTGNNVEQICDVMCKELEQLERWFRANKLSLNVSKTNFIVFSNKHASCQFNININGVVIDRVYVTKFLGVMVDSKFSWSYHIKHVQGKIAKSIAVINKVRYLLDSNSLYTLYCSLILPYLNYCCEIWGNTYVSRIMSIIKLQKKSVRIIDHASRLEHTNPIFLKYKLLKFVDLIKLNTCVIMYKARCNLLPTRIMKLFQLNVNNTRQQGDFIVHYRRTKLKEFCISVTGVKVWNNLDPSLKDCKNYLVFK